MTDRIGRLLCKLGKHAVTIAEPPRDPETGQRYEAKSGVYVRCVRCGRDGFAIAPGIQIWRKGER